MKDIDSKAWILLIIVLYWTWHCHTHYNPLSMNELQSKCPRDMSMSFTINIGEYYTVCLYTSVLCYLLWWDSMQITY